MSAAARLAHGQATRPGQTLLDEGTGESPSLRWGMATWDDGEFIVRQWVASNGLDFGNVTYTCARANWPGELAEVEAMVQGARFEVEAAAA